MEHKNCKCAICEHGIDAVRKMQKESIIKYGWYVHFVQDPRCPANTNAHTHHVMESFKHKDFQICLKKGVKYEPGKKYDNIIEKFKVEFIEVTEGGRSVLRILIPDENGKYEGMYAEQLTKLNNADLNINMN